MGSRSATQGCDLRTKALHRELERGHEHSVVDGWHHDEYVAELPAEPPGLPTPDGSWEIAREIIRTYQFSDPNIVTAIYYSDHPLAQHVRLLRTRFFWFFTFYLAIWIEDPFEEVYTSEEGRTQLWGYRYHALEHNFERGYMIFEVAKRLETGKVLFRIRVRSQRGHIANVVYRLGFELFGRWQQTRYTENALERVQKLVKEQLDALARQEPPPPLDGPPIRPASTDEHAAKVMEQIVAQLHNGSARTTPIE